MDSSRQRRSLDRVIGFAPDVTSISGLRKRYARFASKLSPHNRVCTGVGKQQGIRRLFRKNVNNRSKPLKHTLGQSKHESKAIQIEDDVEIESGSNHSTSDLEAVVKEMGNDFKLYQDRRNTNPKRSRKQGGDCTRQQLEEKGLLLRDSSRDLDDLINGKSKRIARLKSECETCREKVREECLAEQAAAEASERLRGKIHTHMVGMDKFRSETRALQLVA